MPKLKERQDEKQDRLFAAFLAKNMALRQISSQDEIAKMLGINRSTLNYKLKNPDRFTRKELRSLFKMLGFTDEEKSQVV
ncbi:helix-turn-helix domain-containing protein [Bacilliculturomica massiliensis]|uniref:helix-turn-helix domain-containing protein n=1 Tax=Bacilliculturomica massiliensis TaxID=1917867 RepID=UPI00103054AD|nr:helix-turn-helix domain-containing protein [Bacilliculturomica massiliensis]